MKKFTIGCLAAIGVFAVVLVGVYLVDTIFDSDGTTDTTPTQTLAVTTTPTTAMTTPPTPTTTQPPTFTTMTETTEQPTIELEFVAALDEGLIEYTARGKNSVTRIQLGLTSISDNPLQITVLPGTIFSSQPSDVQSMIVIKEKALPLLEPHDALGPIYIDVAGINMQLEVPGESDSLIVSSTPPSEGLMKLINLTDFPEETSRVRQFAIWTFTDNPKRGEYASCGLGPNPYDDEIEEIRVLFNKAELSTDDYWALKIPVYVELIEAQSKGLIEVSACGTGSINRIQMSLTSNSDDVLEVAILPGTIFTSSAASVQSMVVITEKVLPLLYPDETIGPVNVDAACANMELDAPEESNTLALSTEVPPEDLVKLLYLPDFHEETSRVQQFAIWTITDNPERGGYMGIGYFGMGSGPSDEEMEKIRVLFEKAGISTDKYKALG